MNNESSNFREGDLYKTTNIYQTAWLLISGKELKDIDKYNPKRAIFTFIDEEKNCEKLITDFWSNDVLQKFISKIQDVKAMLYADNSRNNYQFRERGNYYKNNYRDEYKDDHNTSFKGKSLW